MRLEALAFSGLKFGLHALLFTVIDLCVFALAVHDSVIPLSVVSEAPAAVRPVTVLPVVLELAWHLYCIGMELMNSYYKRVIIRTEEPIIRCILTMKCNY